MTELNVEIRPDGIAFITLNRPDVHNAFNDVLIKSLTDSFTDLSQNDDVRVVILSGAGKSFCAGGDLNWMKAAADFSYEENVADAMRLSTMLSAINTCSKPVIAAIHGIAFGGGVGLAACSDIVVASSSTKFSLSEVKLGLAPSTIGPYVVATIGESHARRYFLTAERFGATEAHHIGLVHHISDDPMSKAQEIALSILDNAPGAITAAKQLIQTVVSREITPQLREETAEHIAARRATAEGKEGLAAFFEKRKPSWSKKS